MHDGSKKYIKKNWLEDLNGRENFGDIGIVGRILLICILDKQVVEVWTGLNFLRIGFIGGVLWTL